MPQKKTTRKVADIIGDPGAEQMPESKSKKCCSHGKGIVLTVIIIIIVILIGWYFIGYAGGGMKLPGYSSAPDDWSAVFLSNGQVYFGKVQTRTKSDLVLADIYYLQVVTVPLQRTQEGADTDQQTQQELKLIKLGNELHGPADAMVINRDHILLVEKLKDNSRVVEAISDYLANQPE